MMNASKLKVGPRGFTLVELLMAIGIASVVLTAGIMMITNTIKAQSESTASIRAAENARMFFQSLERDLRAAYPNAEIVHKENLVQPDTPIAVQDTINFYTRIDHILSAYNPNDPDAAPASAQDEDFFVRYYVNENTQLCREVVDSRKNPEVADSAPLAFVSQKDNTALFEDVYSVRFFYRRYNELTKDYVPKLTENYDTGEAKKDCTHLLVKVIMADRFAEERIRLRMLQLKGTSDADALKQTTYRTFTKVIPLPEAFTQ